ncbi:hypothetical protein J6590_074534 [Homalodisca vitripennis]|nr:hypothetical protein J6590_074534 [Homalodisca vitripennis]
MNPHWIQQKPTGYFNLSNVWMSKSGTPLTSNVETLGEEGKLRNNTANLNEKLTESTVVRLQKRSNVERGTWNVERGT